MVYEQKKDRVGIDESFPFPIKLTYDANNIYLTPMWVPSQLQNIVNSNDEYRMLLTLEVATTRANYNIRNTGKIPWNSGHPCTTGKFYLPGAATSVNKFFRTWEVGNTYTISMQDFNRYFIPSNLRRLQAKGGTIFMKIRGAYRISNSLGYQRTQYHSNTAELTV